MRRLLRWPAAARAAGWLCFAYLSTLALIDRQLLDLVLGILAVMLTDKIELEHRVEELEQRWSGR